MVPDVNYNEAYISFVLVHPEWRRGGIGTYMIYHLIQTCMGKDVTLHVSVTNPAMLMYQKFGFKPEELIQEFYSRYLPQDSPQCRHAFFLRLRRWTFSQYLPAIKYIYIPRRNFSLVTVSADLISKDLTGEGKWGCEFQSMPVIEILLLYYKYIISLRHDETPLFVNWLRPLSLSLSLFPSRTYQLPSSLWCILTKFQV